jgi:hypothetical protein
MICSRPEMLTALGMASSATDQELGLLNFAHPKAEWLVKQYLQNDVEYAMHVEYLPNRDRLTDRDILVDAQIRGNTATFIPGAVDNRKLQLKHTPVWISGIVDGDTIEVREDSDAYGGQSTSPFPSASILVRGRDYMVDINEQIGGVDVSKNGQLIRIGSWSIMPRSIKVTYPGGWTAAHLDGVASGIKAAVAVTVIKAFNQAVVWRGGKGRGPVVSESLGHTSVMYSESLARMTGLMTGLPPEAKEYLQPFLNYAR